MRMTTQVTNTRRLQHPASSAASLANKLPPVSFTKTSRYWLFSTLDQLNEGHTLVIPRTHYETVYDIPEDLVCHIYKLVKRLSVVVKDATKADGITIIQQNGPAAGQEVFHLHVHVVPRFEGQKLPHFREIPNASRQKLEEAAETIRKRLQT